MRNKSKIIQNIERIQTTRIVHVLGMQQLVSRLSMSVTKCVRLQILKQCI